MAQLIESFRSSKWLQRQDRQSDTQQWQSSMYLLSTAAIPYTCDKTIQYEGLIAFLSSVRASAMFPVDCRRLINFGLSQIRIRRPWLDTSGSEYDLGSCAFWVWNIILCTRCGRFKKRVGFFKKASEVFCVLHILGTVRSESRCALRK
jgi:hypothetical protein